MEVTGDQQLFDFPHSSKYILCSKEAIKTHSGLKQLESEFNDDTIFIFGWIIHVMLIK